MMRVLLVAQPLKQSLGLPDVTEAVLKGAQAAGADATVLAGSDGGDGLLDALAASIVRWSHHAVAGPTGSPTSVPVGWLDDQTAVIESRLACGLALVPVDRRNPETLTTRGVGELIAAVAAAGARAAYVGLGGSATVDGGGGLTIAWAGHRPALTLTGLCDVLVPLEGALRFAGQKGANEAMTARLSARLTRLAIRHPEAAGLPGAGAAGGLGFGLVVHGGATLVSGAGWMLERLGFAAALANADLVVVTEGAFDDTSLLGKLTGAVLARAAAAGCRAAIVAPRVTAAPPGVLVESGGGYWTAETLHDRVAALVRRVSET